MIDIHTHHPIDDSYRIQIHSPVKDEEPIGKHIAGLHPWYLSEYHDLKALEEKLQNPGCIGLGECGLDRSIDFDFEEQLFYFKEQIDLAIKFEKKLIVLHCVKAFDQIMAPLKKFKGKILFHDYNGSPEQTEQLLKDERVYFSYGALLSKEQSKAMKSLPLIGLERLFVESDEHPQKLENHYQLMAQAKGVSTGELMEVIKVNFSALQF